MQFYFQFPEDAVLPKYIIVREAEKIILGTRNDECV